MSQTSSGPSMVDLLGTCDLPVRPAQRPGRHAPVRPKTSASSDDALAPMRFDDCGKCHLRIDASCLPSPSSAAPSSYFWAKPLVEFVVTAGLMIIAIPVMAVVAVLILVLEGRPIFYRQTRVGKNGTLFRIWKFRSMRTDAEQDTGAVWSGDNDPRVTTIGRWLRCSHIDELPQLINILSGDMSLIGPRPERPEFVRELSRELPTYMERLCVRPGITGLAQLGLGYDQCVSDVQLKIELDLKYINNANPLNDCRLFLQTFPYIIKMLVAKWVADHQKTQALAHPTLTSSDALASKPRVNSINATANTPSRSLAG